MKFSIASFAFALSLLEIGSFALAADTASSKSNRMSNIQGLKQKLRGKTQTKHEAEIPKAAAAAAPIDETQTNENGMQKRKMQSLLTEEEIEDQILAEHYDHMIMEEEKEEEMEEEEEDEMEIEMEDEEEFNAEMEAKDFDESTIGVITLDPAEEDEEYDMFMGMDEMEGGDYMEEEELLELEKEISDELNGEDFEEDMMDDFMYNGTSYGEDDFLEEEYYDDKYYDKMEEQELAFGDVLGEENDAMYEGMMMNENSYYEDNAEVITLEPEN